MIAKVINQLEDLFKNYNCNRYLIHEKAVSILEEASKNNEFLFDAIRQNLADPMFLQRNRHYPTLSLPIVESAEFSLVINIFPPLPSRRTDISFQSIHHHGSLLLSTVGVFGPGYSSIVFKKGFVIDEITLITDMIIEKEYQNALSKVEFIDSYQPHIVFYPQNFSATIAFWCDDKPKLKESIKKLKWVNQIKKPARKIVSFLGLSNFFGINKVEFFDFFVEENNIKALKDRLSYDKVGDNENFVQNIFSFIQQTGFKDKIFLENLYSKSEVSDLTKHFIKKILNEEKIIDNFFNGHLDIEKVNIQKSRIIHLKNN